MKARRLLVILLTATLGFAGDALSPHAIVRPGGSHLRLLRSDEKAVVLELTVDGFQIQTFQNDGNTYQTVSVSNTVQSTVPGAPQVPIQGTLLAVPTMRGLSLTLIEVDYETLRGYRLSPSPNLSGVPDLLGPTSAERIRTTYAVDESLYTRDAFYPDRAAAFGDIGYVGEQPVAQVQFFPVQYNPVSGELRLYRRILVRVTWKPPQVLQPESSSGRNSLAFDKLLGSTLLNYDSLLRPQMAGPRPASPGSTVSTTSSTALKVGVTEDGLYQLTQADLTAAGMDLSGVDPHTIKISNLGEEIPVYVQGETDGVFDPGDTILFYGTAITDVYTLENVYWVTVGGGAGSRMTTRSGALSGSATVPTHFPITLHAENDNYYWQTMPDGAGQDHWFWDGRLSAPGSRDHTVTLSHISTSAASATMRVRLKGGTDDVSTDPDHHTRILLNGIEIDEQLWNGMAVLDHGPAAFSHSLLYDGLNTVSVESVGDTSAVVDQIFVNWIEIDYWDTYTAENDVLLFGAPGSGTFEFDVGGFGNSSVTVFDVTDRSSVVRITDVDVLDQGGSFQVRFEDQAQSETRYLALTPSQYKSPARVVLDEPSSLKSTSHGADYIIVTHGDFYTSSLRLANHRATFSGIRVETVKVEDVYDEFNFGIFNPRAIRDFLAYAYNNWTPAAPSYVVLFGDAYQDYKDNLQTGTVNYVPSQIVETYLLGQTPSDNWFVTVSGEDVLPDMFIGRLSVQNVSQADNVVDKIIQYEQNPPDGSWNTNVLLVADDGELSFESISDELAQQLPHYYTANKVYVSRYPPGDPTLDISSAINAGSLLVNYTGHGDVRMWGLWNGGEHIFDLSDINALTNLHKLPLVIVANCLNGFFAGNKNQVSLAEAFLRLEDKGAVAVWAPTGLGFPSGHQELMRNFYKAVFQDDLYAAGVATTAAKIAAYAQTSVWGELVETFVLFGDPAMQLGLPENYPYVEQTAPADGTRNVATDEPVQIFFSKPMLTSTVTLTGKGALGLPLTGTWNAEETVVVYAHADFEQGQHVTFTVTGQDRLGNTLGLGPVPATWSFSVTSGEETFRIYLPAVIKDK